MPYARRTHHAAVTLKSGESRTYRLQPVTPGPFVIDAAVAGAPPPPPHTLVAGTTTTTTSGTGSGPGSGTPPVIPTDLTLELLHGSQLVATESHHILAQASGTDDAWHLRITRKATGAPDQLYIITADYASVLPILTRDVPFAALQRAFDSNWNQNQYVSFEIRSNKLNIKFDPAFKTLYNLSDLWIDLIPTWVATLPHIKSTGIGFTMQVIDGQPAMRVRVTAHDVDHPNVDPALRLDLYFVLYPAANGVTYLVRVESPLIDALHELVIPTKGRGDTIARAAIVDALEQLQTTRPLGARLAPWLIGDLRPLYNLTANASAMHVAWLGLAAPPDAGPVVLDPSRPAPPPPDTTPRLFDAPDELPHPVGSTLPTGLPHPGPITTAGALASINHFVVLMMENRSFDQVLGYLSKDAGRTDVDGLSPRPADDTNDQWNDGPSGRRYWPMPALGTAWGYTHKGPCHEADCVQGQITDSMKHFVSDFAKRVGDSPTELQRVMAYYTPDQLRAYAALTDDFAICDSWFCAHQGPTWPNRFVTFTGTLNRDAFGEPELNQPALEDLVPITHPTIFDHLAERGVTWRLYEHGYSFLRLYGKYTFDQTHVASFTDPVHGFVADARAGRLPQVTWIEPDYIDLPPGNDDHPPGDMADGQRLIATIVSALLESPQWQDTMLIITYDEHGGFYDHRVPPPGPPLVNDRTERGPRVPAFIVSPWVARGAVCHTVLDHTAILATLLRRFCSPRPPRLSLRADGAADLRELVQQQPRPRADFDVLHRRLAAVLATPPSPPQPKQLKTVDDADDFHGLLAYMATFT